MQLRPDEAARVLKACDISAGDRPSGLLAMAESTLRGDRPERPPVEVVVHLDAVSAEISEQLLCDAGLVVVTR